MRQRLSFLVVSACGVRAFCSIVTGPVCGVRLWAAFVSGVGLTAARAHLVGFERDLPSRTLVGWGGEMGGLRFGRFVVKFPEEEEALGNHSTQSPASV